MTEPIHFPGRDVPSFGEYVKPEELVVGGIYFRAVFADDEMLVPELTPLVFAGRDLHRENATNSSHQLFFQDYASYARGVRWGMEDPPLDAETEEERIEQFMSRGWFETVEETQPHVFVFEKALDVLLRCALRRRERAV